MEILSDKAILKAFNGDFGEIAFDHKPTLEDIMLIKLKLVAQEAHQDAIRQMVEWGEKLCVEHRHMDLSISHLRRCCPECWQELKADR